MEDISVALLCSLLGAAISYLTFQKNNKKDIKTETREEAETKAKLDYIVAAVDEIRLDNKARDREIKDLRERVIIIESSTKSAHKRIDKWEKEFDRNE